MIQVIVGGVIAIIGGVLASCINAAYQRREIRAREFVQRERDKIAKRNSSYYEFTAFLNQFLQFLHPSVGEREQGKYTAGQSLVDHIRALAHSGAGVQLYGSEIVCATSHKFFDCYNEIVGKNHQIDEKLFSQLSSLVAELMTQMRIEIESDCKRMTHINDTKDEMASVRHIGNKKILRHLKDWSNIVVAGATVIACFIASCELQSGAKAWEMATEMFMSAERPVFCVERVPYLAADGKNFNHEDCRISNIGAAPRYYLVRNIKEYLVMNFIGSHVPHWSRTVVLPIQFYSYGVLRQGLKGVIYEKKGEGARLKAFEHYNKTRDFFAARGIGYSDSVVILAHVCYVDRFGKEIDCYYKCNPVGGQRELTKEEYEQYALDAQAYLESTIPVEFDKIDLDAMLNNWVLPESPVTKTLDSSPSQLMTND